MKKYILYVILSFTTIFTMSAQNDLMEFAKEGKSTVKQVDTTRVLAHKYNVSYINDRYICEGKMHIPNMSANRILTNTLSFLATWDKGDKQRHLVVGLGYSFERYGKVKYPSEGLINVNTEKNMLNFGTGVIELGYGDFTYYKYFKIVCGAKQDTLSFVIYDCKFVKTNAFGLNKGWTTFEERYGDKKNLSMKYREEIELFNEKLSAFLNQMNDAILNDTYKRPIIHWKQINEHTIKVGMTEIECLLSWRKPKEKNVILSETGTDEQWIYESDYVHFHEGEISSIIEK